MKVIRHEMKDLGPKELPIMAMRLSTRGVEPYPPHLYEQLTF